MRRLLTTGLLVLHIMTFLPPAADAGAEMAQPQTCLTVARAGGGDMDNEMVIALILRALALPARPTEMQERRFEHLADCIGVGRRDTDILRREMVRLYELMTPIQQKLQTGGAGAEARKYLDAYRAVRLETWDRLQELLSEGGKKRLLEFVEEAKRNGRNR